MQDWFIKLRNDLEARNLNKLVVKTGRPGTGKSYSALKMGEILKGDGFNVKKHVAYFSPAQFTRIIRKAKKGDVVIFDEAGVGINAREWASASNMLITKILQTFRTKNLFVIFTVPDFGFVDIHARKVFHNFVSMKPINFKKNVAVGKWFDIINNDWTGKMSRWTLKIDVNGRKQEVDKITYDKPKENTCEEYEVLRAKALDTLLEGADLLELGGGRAVTVPEASKLLRMSSSLMYELIGDGAIPLEAETNSMKISLALVRKIRKELECAQYPGFKVESVFDKPDKLPFYELPDNTFLTLYDPIDV